MKFDVIIIGGGAAGLFCAIEAGKRGRKTLVIEHNSQVGRKIIISGGGRCNFTNLNVGPENFRSANPHFCKSALARYTPNDFITLVKKHNIDFYEKKLGQLFCRGSSRQIVDMLVHESEKYGVQFQLDCAVGKVEKSGEFHIITTRGDHFAESLVIATGGLSFPKVGASDFGFRIGQQFSLKFTLCRPSLVAMMVARKDSAPNLAGISIDAEVSAGIQSFRENILFTHRGLSGPAILQVSNYWTKGSPVEINLLPGIDIGELLQANRNRSQTGINFIAGWLPRRFAESSLFDNLLSKPLNVLNDREINLITDALSRWRVEFQDTEGYERAEVTLGGLSTDELSSKTMETKKTKGLYFIGELVDVTGWMGGYNFQWAWSSGFAAGQHV